MSEIIRKDFIAYEYKEIIIPRYLRNMYIDAYKCFGWKLNDTSVLGIYSLSMKRDRTILNKTELTRLQRQFDACANEIIALVKSKTSNATALALVIGLIGCAFLAVSVFAITAAVPNILLCIIFGIPGLILWTLTYFIYKSAVAKRTKKVEPLIEAKYDEIYEICEKANNLLPK